MSRVKDSKKKKLNIIYIYKKENFYKVQETLKSRLTKMLSDNQLDCLLGEKLYCHKHGHTIRISEVL